MLAHPVAVLLEARAAGVELSPRLKVRATPARRRKGKAPAARKAATTPAETNGGAGSGPTAREVALLEEIIKRNKENPQGLDQWLDGVLYVMKEEMRQ